MAFLIDGNNLAGQLFPHELRGRGSRHRLVSKLLAFQKTKKSRVYLVFDGPPDSELAEISRWRKKFFVLFPDPGKRADDVIKDVISRQTDYRQFFLVSSDRELRSFARAKGAKILTAKEFSSLLKKILHEHRAAAELEKKPRPNLSRFEVGLWLEAFERKHG